MNKVWTVRLHTSQPIAKMKDSPRANSIDRGQWLNACAVRVYESKRFTGPEAEDLAMKCARANVSRLIDIAWSVE